MPALDILESQERQRLASMSLKQAHDAVKRGLYTIAELYKVNDEVKRFCIIANLEDEQIQAKETRRWQSER